MKVKVTLSADFGHPSNRPTKEYVFELVSKELPKIVSKSKELGGWDVTGVEVE